MGRGVRVRENLYRTSDLGPSTYSVQRGLQLKDLRDLKDLTMQVDSELVLCSALKITTHLNHLSHCKTMSGTNWSNMWTYRVSIIITRRDWIDSWNLAGADATLANRWRMHCESGQPRAVHLSRHEWPGGLLSSHTDASGRGGVQVDSELVLCSPSAHAPSLLWLSQVSLNLTFWFRSTHLSTLERNRTRSHQTGESEQTSGLSTFPGIIDCKLERTRCASAHTPTLLWLSLRD